MIGAGPHVRFHFRTALALGLAVFLIVFLFRFPAVNPECWADLAAAAGLRPPLAPLGGLIRGVFAAIFALAPAETAFDLIRVGGWLLGALIAMSAYWALGLFCGNWIDRIAETARGRRVVFVSLATAAFAFVTSDPVWYAVQSLSGVSIRLALGLAAVITLRLFVKRRRRRFALVSMALWAVLTGDWPWAIVGAVATWVTVFSVMRTGEDDEIGLCFANPLVQLTMRRVLALIFAVVFIVTVVLECGAFLDLGGFRAMEWDVAPMKAYVGYFKECQQLVIRSADWRAWILAFAVLAGPMIVLRFVRDRALNDERFMSVTAIVTTIGCYFLSWSQLCGIRPLHFDNWAEDCVVRDPTVAAVFAFVAALILAWTLLALGAALLLVEPRDLAQFSNEDAAESAAGRWAVKILDRLRRASVPLAVGAPLFVVVTILPFRYEATLHRMLEVIDGYLDETLREAAVAERIFTDGGLDAGLELEAWRHGTPLYAVSVMTGNSGYEVALRRRGLSHEDDLELAGRGAFTLMRAWATDLPERLTNACVQVGFELWRDKRDKPTFLGTLALPPGAGPVESPARFVNRARDLAEQAIAAGKGGADTVGTKRLREIFRFVQWRLARIAEFRAEAAAGDGWGEASELDQSLANRLDAVNGGVAEMKRRLGRGAEAKGELLSPREGLRLGLSRADFRLAARYAESVIIARPDDPEANFALGMNLFLSKDWVRAEPYLRRCLLQRPDDPAVLNNLAVIQLRLYRFDEAEAYAKAALERLPDSPLVKRTLKAIEEARPQQE